jgi:ABC-2 type transport system ATP-binding protein
MEEAERLCDRVGIIDEGRLVAEGTRRELVALVGGRDRVTLVASGDLAAGVAAADRVEGVQAASQRDGAIEILVSDARSVLPRLIEAVVPAGAGVAVRSVDVVEPDLEAVFLHLTGKALRDT